MIFDLVRDFADVLNAMPREHGQHRVLTLLDEALRRDVHFIDRHREDYPQALFQCLWNSCWWYDCPEASRHYTLPDTPWETHAPWLHAKPELHLLLEEWEARKTELAASFLWVESLRPPLVQLGCGQRAVLRGHEDDVIAIKFAADGKLLASLAKDRTLRFWDLRSGAAIRVIRGDFKAFADVPEDNNVVCLCNDGTLQAWDANTGMEVAVTKHLRPIGRYSPDGTRCVSSSGETTTIWSTDSGEELTSFCDQDGFVLLVCYSRDSQRIVTESVEAKSSRHPRYTLRVWSAVDGSQLASSTGDCSVKTISFSPDGDRLLFIGHFGTTAYVMDAASCQLLLRVLRPDFRMELATFTPDGQRFLTVAHSRSIVREWDAVTGEALRSFRGHEDAIQCISYSIDGTCFATGASDQTIRIWTTANRKVPARLHGHESRITAFRYSPDGACVVSGSGSLGDPDDVSAYIWNSANGEQLAALTGHTGEVHDFCFSPEGERIYSCEASFNAGSRDDCVRAWKITTGECLAVLRGHRTWVMTLSCSPDGSKIASGSYDRTVRIWSIDPGTEATVLEGNHDAILCLRYSPDGMHLVAANRDGTIQVWDAMKYSALSVLAGHEDAVRCVCYSPDATQIASGSEDCTIRVWDAATRSELRVLRGHTRTVWGLAYSRDGTRLASSSFDNTIRIWDAQTGNCLECHDGRGDVGAMAAGPQHFRWRALSHLTETVVEDASTGRAIAWLPASPDKLLTHPCGGAWAGRIENYLCLFELQGDTH